MLAVMVCALHLALGANDLRRQVLWCPAQGPCATYDSLCNTKVSDLYTENCEVAGSQQIETERRRVEECVMLHIQTTQYCRSAA